MIPQKHYVHFITFVIIIKDTSQSPYTYIIKLPIFLDIIENCMSIFLRIFSSFMTVGPDLTCCCFIFVAVVVVVVSAAAVIA